MTSSVFDHPWLGGLFAEPDIALCWSSTRQMQHMLRFEAAFTQALQQFDLIPKPDADAALSAIAAFEPDMTALRASTRRDGIVLPGLVQALRQGVPNPKAIHTGATSQDVMDTALALTLHEVSALITDRIDQLCDALQQLEARFGNAKIMGRTRMQAALEITAGQRIRSWYGPFQDWREGFGRTSRAVARLQLGGPVGDRRNLGKDPDAFCACVADALGLAPSGVWHSTRLPLVDYGNAMATLCGCLGKIGADISLMAQQGVGDLKLSAGGSSSAMPFKVNPVLAELLVTLARYSAGQAGTLMQALVHEQERSGEAWALEWMILPQLTEAAGAAIGAAQDLTGQIESIGTPA